MAKTDYVAQRGTTGADILLGGDTTNDKIIGGAGPDRLYGQGGHDLLIGDKAPEVDNRRVDFVTLIGQAPAATILVGEDDFDQVSALTGFTYELLASFRAGVTEEQVVAVIPGGAEVVLAADGRLIYRVNDTDFNVTPTGVSLTDGAFHRISVVHDPDGASAFGAGVRVVVDGDRATQLGTGALSATPITTDQEISFGFWGELVNFRLFDDVRTSAGLLADAFANADTNDPSLIVNAFAQNGHDGEGVFADGIGGWLLSGLEDAYFGTTRLYGYDDYLSGGAGRDKLLGLEGADILNGGTGRDLLDGGKGYDLAEYVAATEGVSVNLTLGKGLSGEAKGDKLISIEAIAGSLFDDKLVGDKRGNGLYGLDGDDRLIGLKGGDVLSGGAGDDVLKGGAGRDRFLAGTGENVISGGRGYDSLSFADATTGVAVDMALGTATRGAEVDQFTGIEEVIGSANNDVLRGDAGHNALVGGDGDDRFNGRLGNDLYVGGAGADRFFFDTDDGSDVIFDFEDGVDKIEILGLSSFGEMTVNVVDEYEVRLEFGFTNVTVLGEEAFTLTADDFNFFGPI